MQVTRNAKIKSLQTMRNTIKEKSSPTTATSSGQDIQAHVAQSDGDITAPIQPRGEANVGPTKALQPPSQPIRQPRTPPPRTVRHTRVPTATRPPHQGRASPPAHAHSVSAVGRGGPQDRVGRRHMVVRGAPGRSSVRGARAGRRVVGPPRGTSSLVHQRHPGGCCPSRGSSSAIHRPPPPLVGPRRLPPPPPPGGCPAALAYGGLFRPRVVVRPRSSCTPRWRPTSAGTGGATSLLGSVRLGLLCGGVAAGGDERVDPAHAGPHPLPGRRWVGRRDCLLGADAALAGHVGARGGASVERHHGSPVSLQGRLHADQRPTSGGADNVVLHYAGVGVHRAVPAVPQTCVGLPPEVPQRTCPLVGRCA